MLEMTERKADSGGLFSVIGQLLADAIWTHDLVADEFTWIAVPENQQKYALPGKPTIIDTWLKRIHQEDRERIADKRQQMLKDASVTIYEQEYRYKGAERYYYIRDKVRIERDQRGVPVKCVGAWKDLTDLYDREQELRVALASQESLNAQMRQYQEQLGRNEESLKNINEQLKQNLAILSMNEFMLNKSQQITRTGSWRVDVATGKFSFSEEFGMMCPARVVTDSININEVFRSLYGNENADDISMSLERLKTTGKPVDHVFSYLAESGRQKWINLRAFPFYDQKEVLSEIIGVVHDITSFKEKEDELKKTEEKFSTLFQCTPDFMSLIRERDNVIVEANERVLDLVGYNRDEVVGKNVDDLHLWVDEETKRLFVEEYTTQGSASREGRWRTRTGEVVDVLVNAVRVVINDEAFRLSLGTDISQRRRAEEKFSKAFNFSPDVMIIVRERDLTIIDANDKITWLTGLKREEVVGKQIDQSRFGFGGVDKSRLPSDEGIDLRIQSAITRSNGEEFFASISVNRIDLAGEDHMLIILRDITEQKLAESLLRRSEANLNATINNTRMQIWSIDIHYTLLTCNEAMREYLKEQYHEDVHIGDDLREKILDKMSAASRQFWQTMYTKAFAGQPVLQNYKEFNDYFEVSVNPIIEGGEITSVTAFSMNTTEKVLHHMEVVKNLERIADAEKRVGEVRLMALRAAMNPHFIFNALNSIQFFIAKNEKKQAIQYLSKFSKLIRGILTGAAQKTVRLAEEIAILEHYTALELVRFENKFAVEFKIDPRVDIDNIEVPALLIQPFVENAILHGLCNKRGQGRLLISILRRNADYIVVEIEDNGIGRAAARELQRNAPVSHKSMGISLAEERLKVVNTQMDSRLSVETEDLYDGDIAAGTRVRMWLQVH